MRTARLATALCFAACTNNLDRATEVKDLRLLAIKAEPPEILLAEPAPMPMRFSALVVDPRGGEVEYSWSFCPVESSTACLDYERLRDQADESFRSALDTMRNIPGPSGTALPRSQTSIVPEIHWWTERAVWPYAVPDYVYTAPPELYLYHLEESLLGFGTGAWPSAQLDVRKGNEEVRAEKRIVIGIQDLRGVAEMLVTDWGVVLCPEDPAAERPEGCVDVQSFPPNSNPVFSAVRIARGSSALTPFTEELSIGEPGDVAGVLRVHSTEAVRILPELTAASFEPYQEVSVNLQSRQIEVVPVTEEISINWYVSHGQVQDALTWPLFTKTLDTIYTAPIEPPAETNGRATLWMIARDARGGTEWMSVEILVIP